jgi:hypothetical protein
MPSQSIQQPRPVHVPPSLGANVDQVLREFLAQSDAWIGIYVIEATLVVSDAGPARKYRAALPSPSVRSTRIGVSSAGGLCLRESTEAEEAELEDGLRRGFVQIERFRARSGERHVLHQATGREIPIN